MKVRHYILFISLLSVHFVYAQNTGSLLRVFNNTHLQDTVRIKAIHKVAKSFRYSNPDSALILYKQEIAFAQKTNQKKSESNALYNIGLIYNDMDEITKALDYYNKSLELRKEIGDKNGMAWALNNIGAIYDKQADIPKALDYYDKSLKLFEESGEKNGMSSALNNIGLIYKNKGDIPKALEYNSRSLKIKESAGDKEGMAWSLYNIGLIYQEQGDIPKALDYYQKSLKTEEETGNKEGMAWALNNIGTIYSNQGDIAKALDYYEKSLQLEEEIDDKQGMGNALSNIGVIYVKQGNLPKALNCYQKTFQLKEEAGDMDGMATSLNDIGSIYFQQGNLSKALDYSQRSMKIAREIGYVERIKDASQSLFTVYKKTGNTKLALENYELYTLMRDSIANEKNTKATVKQQMQYEYEKKTTADSIVVAEERKVNALKFEQEKKQRWFLYGGLALVAIFAAFMFNRFRVTQKQNKIIAQQKREVETQKHLVEEKHKEITDSINYAERIQKSFLATQQHLNANLSEYFILFKPKDVVSGDFYWSATLANGNFALVTADSTGHGVPGAIMSLLNITSLEKAIEHATGPAGILNATRKTIIERLKKDGSAEGGKDGMDCSLCAFDFVNRRMYVAAANNPVWIVRGAANETGEPELMEIKPDKMPVGKHDKQDISFTQHEIELQKGDVVYTLTDGFPDQFGGGQGKKFMIKKLRELVVANAHLPMAEQKVLLEKAFSDWTGTLEQIDDVTVIGIRV
jgi:tetratricopeptide (TPR) repeat protein